MAVHLASYAVRRVPNSPFVSIDRRNSLSASILAGFGMFALAASGMCPMLLAGTAPLQSESKLSVGNGPSQ